MSQRRTGENDTMTTYTAHIYSINPDNGTKIASGADRDDAIKQARAWALKSNRTAEVRENGRPVVRIAMNGKAVDVAR